MSYIEIQNKLQSEFEFWCKNRSNNYYRLGYSTGVDGMFAKGSKPTMPAATLAYGDLKKLTDWWKAHAGSVVAEWSDAVKDVTQNASFSFERTQDFVVVTKDGGGNRTSGFNFHILYDPVPPPVAVTGPDLVTPSVSTQVPTPVVKSVGLTYTPGREFVPGKGW